jgi:hypothetical protein
MTLFTWSKVADNNDIADATINWLEGQAPSSINNSARAMMAAVAKYRDDVAGKATTGTSTAYVLATNQVFTSLATALDGNIVGIVPNVTSGSSPTLNVDGLGAKPMRNSPGLPIANGQLIAGSYYIFQYNHADGVFYLLNPPVTSWLVPIGAIMPYTVSAAVPNSRYALCQGQAISRTSFAALFALIGTTYGIGDGSTTFNIPNLQGRAVIGQAAASGPIPSGLTTTTGTNSAGQVIGWTFTLPFIIRVL